MIAVWSIRCFQRDRLAGQQRRAPAEAGRERDLGVLLGISASRISWSKRAVEVAAAVEQSFGDARAFRRASPRTAARPCAISAAISGSARQQVGEHRQQPVAVAASRPTCPTSRSSTPRNLPFEPALVTSVLPTARCGAGTRVVRVAAEDGVDAAHARGELQIDVHAVVRQQHDRLRALARAPRRPSSAGARPGCRRSSPARSSAGWRSACTGNAWPMIATGTPFTSRSAYGLNTGSSKSSGAHVLREELDRREIVLDGLLHALRAVGEFPVRRHEVDAQELLRADHVGAAGPQRRRRALPAVAAVEQQRAAAARRAAASPAWRGARSRRACRSARASGFEIEMRERVGGAAAGGADAEALLSEARDAVRLAEIHRQELRMHVGDVQERDVAERRRIVELGRGLRRGSPRAARLAPAATASSETPRGSSRRCNCYWLTGEAGSSSSPTRSLICCSVSVPEWPRRGICEQTLYALAL